MVSSICLPKDNAPLHTWAFVSRDSSFTALYFLLGKTESDLNNGVSNEFLTGNPRTSYIDILIRNST